MIALKDFGQDIPNGSTFVVQKYISSWSRSRYTGWVNSQGEPQGLGRRESISAHRIYEGQFADGSFKYGRQVDGDDYGNGALWEYKPGTWTLIKKY